jgi:hypothetical protein
MTDIAYLTNMNTNILKKSISEKINNDNDWQEQFYPYLSNRLLDYFKRNPTKYPIQFIHEEFMYNEEKFYADIFLSKKDDSINYEINDNAISNAVKEVLPENMKNNENYTNAGLIFIMRYIIDKNNTTFENKDIFMFATPELEEYITTWVNNNSPQPTTSNFTRARNFFRNFRKPTGGKKTRKYKKRKSKKNIKRKSKKRARQIY